MMGSGFGMLVVRCRMTCTFLRKMASSIVQSGRMIVLRLELAVLEELAPVLLGSGCVLLGCLFRVGSV